MSSAPRSTAEPERARVEDAPAERPVHADAGRERHFRSVIGSPPAIVGLTLAPLVVAGLGYRLDSGLVLFLGPVVAVLLVAAVAFLVADHRAEEEFFRRLAPVLGLGYRGGAQVRPLTPLLGAGERRRFEHAMEGPLDPEGGARSCRLAHYTFELRRESRRDGHRREHWESHHFTVCVTDVVEGRDFFPGLYARPGRGVFDGTHDWLRASDTEEADSESVVFNRLYDLRVSERQELGPLRELLAPSLVIWLSEHPLKPGFELQGGTLVGYVHGRLEEEWKLAYLREATCHLAARVLRETEEDGHRGPPPPLETVMGSGPPAGYGL